MRISTLGYVGKQGVKNIGRNKMFSIASIATMSACIFLFGLFFSIVLLLIIHTLSDEVRPPQAYIAGCPDGYTLSGVNPPA